ncbi:MAG: hypothetical protein QXF23_06595 [Candidatus Bathyarchaeia archaeon]
MENSHKLRDKSREDLLEIFKREVSNFNLNGLVNSDKLDKLAEYYGLKIGLSMLKARAKENEEVLSKAKEIEGRLRKMRELIHEVECIIRCAELAQEYKRRYEKMVEEGFGTTQKVSNEFLIRAITDVRSCVAEAKKRMKGKHLRSRPYKRPYDWAGYSIDKYPVSIGLDPNKVQCSNCRHWDEKERFCFILNRRTDPKYRCADFGRRGL